MEAEGAWGQFVISAVAHRGVEKLQESLWREARNVIESERGEAEEPEEWRP